MMISKMISWVRWFVRVVSTWLTLKAGSRPRRLIHLFITHAMLWVRRRPALFTLALRAIHFVPPLERRVLASAHSRGMALSYSVANRAGHYEWQIDVEPAVYEKWNKLLK